METKKNRKGLIVLVVVLSILLVGLIGYTCYDKLVFDKKSNDKYEELNKTLEKTKENNKQEIEKIKELEKNYIAYNDNTNIYAISSITGINMIVYSFNGKMYLDVNKNNKISQIASASKKNLKFNEEGYAPTDDYSSFTLDMVIKESAVRKVVISKEKEIDYFSHLFVIMKDGSTRVLRIKLEILGSKAEELINKYKIIDIKEECATKIKKSESCEKYSFILTLTDGSAKNVTFKY